MTLSIKATALFGLTAGAVTALIETAVVGGGANAANLLRDGAVVSAIAGLAVHKYQVSQIAKQIEEKADKDVVNSALSRIEERVRRIEDGVDTIRNHLMR